MFYELSRCQILDFYVNTAFISSKMVCIKNFSPEWKIRRMNLSFLTVNQFLNTSGTPECASNFFVFGVKIQSRFCG